MFRSIRPGYALLLLFALALPASAAPVNRLLNPGFEEPVAGHPWMPAAWDTSRSGLSTVFFGRDTQLAHGGQWAVSVANVSTLFPMSHNWSQHVFVGPKDWGKDAVFTVWTRTTSLDAGRAFVLLQAYRDTVTMLMAEWDVEREEALRRMKFTRFDDPLVSLGWSRTVFSERETEWVQRQVRVFVPPLTNVIFVRVGLHGNGQVLLDDASLVFEPARPVAAVRAGENLLRDPGFDGDLSAWELSMPPFDGITVAPDSSVRHGGVASLFSEGKLGAYITARIGAAQAVANRTLGGKRVRLSGWVRTDSLKTAAYAMVYAHTPRGVAIQPQPEQWSRTTPWTRTTLEMDLPRDTYLVWAWFAYDGPKPGRVWWDDCSLEVIGPAKSAGPPVRLGTQPALN